MSDYLISKQGFYLYYVLFYLAGTVDRVVTTFHGRELKPVKKVTGRWLFKTVFYSYFAVIAASVIEFLFFVGRINLIVSVSGFTLFLAGAFLRRRAISDLGSNWAIETEIKEGHELVSHGIYRYFKHPYYLAVLLELLGLCFFSNTFCSVGLIVLVQLPFLILRVKMEEEMLKEYFGKEYNGYFIKSD